MTAAIRTAGLSKRYGDNQALDQVDLVVEEGSVFGFLGPNEQARPHCCAC